MDNQQIILLIIVFIGIVSGFFVIRAAKGMGEDYRGGKVAEEDQLFTCPQGITKYRFGVPAYIEAERFVAKQTQRRTTWEKWFGDEAPKDEVIEELKKRTERQLNNIFAANPNVTLEQLQDASTAVGIKIVSYQKSEAATSKGRSGYVGWSE